MCSQKPSATDCTKSKPCQNLISDANYQYKIANFKETCYNGGENCKCPKCSLFWSSLVCKNTNPPSYCTDPNKYVNNLYYYTPPPFG